jgi:ABC-type uncharacterized transport system permease subunit
MVLLALNIAALAALAAFALAQFASAASGAGGQIRFWAGLLVALAGTGVVAWTDFAAGWRPGLAPALWLTVAATLALYALGSLRCAALARIGALLGPYLFILGALATIWAHAPRAAEAGGAGGPWLGLHIAISVTTYALFTLAAVAGAAVFVQERAMKARRPTRLTALLPAVADGESVQRVLMLMAAVVLGLGLASGMAIEWVESRRLMALNHKTVFSLVAFAVIVALIAVDRASGLAGRRAARLMLLAYLFLTLAYPGVKFVTEIVLGRG